MPKQFPCRRDAGRWGAALRMLCAVTLVLLFAPNGYCSSASTPFEAVNMAQEAIDTSDIDLFRSVVDMDALLQSASDEVRKELVVLAGNGQLADVDPILLATLTSADGLATQVAAQLFFQDVKEYVSIGIRNGYFSGDTVLPNEVAGPFPGVMKHASHAKKEIKPGKTISQKGNRAVVSATLIDHEEGSFPLELGLGKTEQGWRVDSVTNARALTRTIAARRR